MMRTFALVALWSTLIAVSLVRAEETERALTRRESCAALFAPDPADVAHAAQFVRELTDQMAFERGDPRFIERLQSIAEDLVRQNKITPNQAEDNFAARVLGQFTPIFTKFIVAELKFREYEPRQIVDFILNFEDAYAPEVQVDFALAVTRRMLMAINDLPPASKPAGLAQFLAAVEGFGLTTKSYGQFLQIWAQVRGAHPRTVVQFTLANIKNACERVRQDISLRENEVNAPPPAPRWYQFAWWPRDEAPARPSGHELALAALSGLHVPDFIVDVEDLRPEAPRHRSTLEQLLDAESPDAFAAYLERLELRPPFIWDHVLRRRWDDLNFAELRAFAAWPEFQKLNPDLTALAHDKLARFERLRELTAEIRAEDERRAGTLRLGRGEPSFKALNKFIELFSLNLLDQRTRQNMDAAVGAAVSETFMTMRKLHSRLDAADFLLIARKVIEMTFVNADADVAVATLKALVIVSRDYDVTGAEAQDLLDLARLYGLKGANGDGRSLPDLHGAAVFMDPAKWGQPRKAPVVLAPSRLPALVGELRALLPADEAARIDDDQLLNRLTPRSVPGAPGALQFWNNGLLN